MSGGANKSAWWHCHAGVSHEVAYNRGAAGWLCDDCWNFLQKLFRRGN